MKNKISIIIVIVGIILIIIGLFTINTKKEKEDNAKNNTGNEQISKKEEKHIQDITDIIVNKDVTKKQLEELVGSSLEPEDIMVGKDSYLRYRVDSNKIKNHDISKYFDSQDKYATNVEDKIRENFESEETNYVKSEEGDGVITIKYRVYYYALYLSDLMKVSEKLLDYINIDLDDEHLSDSDYSYYQYVSKVKAMEILDNYLDNYKNDNEYREFSVVYNKEKIDDSTNDYYYSCLINYQGAFYENINYDDAGEKAFKNKQNERVNNYLAAAEKTGTLDRNNPLELK